VPFDDGFELLAHAVANVAATTSIATGPTRRVKVCTACRLQSEISLRQSKR
jgi:hypothetical protein